MHIPYGLLSGEVSVATAVAAAPVLGWALHRVKNGFGDRAVPAMGMLGAYLFAAQMINFPVAAGTSGHLLGGALAAYLLGPAPGVLVMSVVVTVQAVLFQDGAVTALGANLLNMAVIGVLVPHLVFRLWRRIGGGRALQTGFGLGAVLSVLAAAAACSLEIAASRVFPLSLVMGTMLGIHTLIGLAEGLITVAILKFLLRVRPDLVRALTGGDPTGLRGGVHADATLD